MEKSFSKKLLIGCVVIALMFVGGSVFARNISQARHPNLAEAQTLIEKAISKLSTAQKANEYDMDGHAAKAKQLLDQAYTEIKEAALAANANKK